MQPPVNETAITDFYNDLTGAFDKVNLNIEVSVNRLYKVVLTGAMLVFVVWHVWAMTKRNRKYTKQLNKLMETTGVAPGVIPAELRAKIGQVAGLSVLQAVTVSCISGALILMFIIL